MEVQADFSFLFLLLLLKTESVSVRMKYITKSIFSKLMELFKSVYFFKAYIFSEINSDLLMLQHRPAFHIRSVQMSTERKMCCMGSFLVTICTAPFPSWRQLDHDHVSLASSLTLYVNENLLSLTPLFDNLWNNRTQSWFVRCARLLFFSIFCSSRFLWDIYIIACISWFVQSKWLIGNYRYRL